MIRMVTRTAIMIKIRVTMSEGEVDSNCRSLGELSFESTAGVRLALELQARKPLNIIRLNRLLEVKYCICDVGRCVCTKL